MLHSFSNDVKWRVKSALARVAPGILQSLLMFINRFRYDAQVHVPVTGVDIETTSMCNSRCVFCPHGMDTITRPKITMGNEMFGDIIAQCAREGINLISFGGLGEFLMDRDFMKKCGMVKQAGLTLNLVGTNGALMTQAVADGVLDLGFRQVCFSIDSPYRDEFEKLRVNLNFDKVVANTMYFLEKHRQRRSPTEVSIICVVEDRRMDARKRDMIKLFSPFLSKKVAMHFLPMHNWGNCDEEDVPLFSLLNAPGSMQIRRVCPRPFVTIPMIRVDGSVSLCCNDYNNKYKMGYFKDGITNAWNGDAIRSIRRKHILGRWKEIDVCWMCSDVFAVQQPVLSVYGPKAPLS